MAASFQPVCGGCAATDPAPVAEARRHLEGAFSLVLSLPDCSGASNLESCRAMEKLLSEAFASLRGIVESHRSGEKGCLSCDPRPELASMGAATVHLGKLLEEKGHADFAPTLRQIEGEVELWTRTRCCSTPAGERSSEAKPSDREDDARAVLTEKCGAEFVDNRRSLRQVMRAPGERQGCYQSRACREAESREGLAILAGFWTYDGEYWYIWAERRTPQGEWVTCEP
jgi:hypothetical protein